ncbi:ferredoxin [Xanthobacter agilis]|uniref:Ferredoxin n=3 Tax=Xanthobacter agilis TaxID=47492 RepID=A0ABU0LHY3_XANAG|nr:ferredoxin [Xanthobacter agilis]MDQ0506729.1 ferredoxin [Xanthobacter agilis]
MCVDMKKCQYHGQCVIAAPDLFSFAEDGSLKWVETIDDSLRQQAEDAADVCPEQAITLEG